jgi:hypothetical protein
VYHSLTFGCNKINTFYANALYSTPSPFEPQWLTIKFKSMCASSKEAQDFHVFHWCLICYSSVNLSHTSGEPISAVPYNCRSRVDSIQADLKGADLDFLGGKAVKVRMVWPSFPLQQAPNFIRSDSKGGDARCQCTSHVVSFVNRSRSISVEGKSRSISIFVEDNLCHKESMEHLLRTNLLQWTPFVLMKGAIKKSQILNKYYCCTAGGVRKTLEVEEE